MKFYFIASVFLLILGSCSGNRCSRDGSRIVRGVIRFKLWDLYRAYNTRMPQTCPFALERDIYYHQEKHKIINSFNNWKCDFCGKSFLTENFLDKHFDRRHSNSVKQSELTVCLSDYCDVYRCDVLSGSRKPDFWDVALCIEDDVQEVRDKCLAQMKHCIPPNLSSNETQHIKDQLNEKVCSFLTCSKYWEVPPPPSDGAAAMYIIMSILITFTVLIYYCLFYQYFYTDTFSDNMNDQFVKPQYPYNMSSSSSKSDLRQRPKH